MEIRSAQDERHDEQGGLNPNAPEFWPSTILSPPALHLHYSSLYLSQATSTPPYNYFTTDDHHPLLYSSQTSFYYINPPPSLPPPRLTSPCTGAGTSYNHRYRSLKYSPLTTTTTRACTHYTDDSNSNYNLIKPRRSSKRSSSQFNQPLPVKPGGPQTTVMIRNIPNQFTRKMLIQFLDEFCNTENSKADRKTDGGDDQEVEFDFVYLPIDFSTKMNKGYAFVNFTIPKGVWKLHMANMENQTWGFRDSPRKRREIALTNIQGKSALIDRFEQTSFGCESDEYLPVSFSPPRNGTSGSEVLERIIGHRHKQIKITNKS